MNHTQRYLLDTDMCIYLLNGHPQVKARVAQVGVPALAVAIPTVGELYFGAYNSGRVEANAARVRAFLSPPGPHVLLILLSNLSRSWSSSAPWRGSGNWRNPTHDTAQLRASPYHHATG